jgi:hypothetical protein
VITSVIQGFADAYPELRENEAFVRQVADSEEERFAATLRQGMALFDDAKTHAEDARISGDAAFKLHDTFGFPIELLEEIAADEGLSVDTDRFAVLLEEQRDRARAAAKEGRCRSGGRNGAADRVRRVPGTRSGIAGGASLGRGQCRVGTRRRRASGFGSSSSGRRSTRRAVVRSAIRARSERTPGRFT